MRPVALACLVAALLVAPAVAQEPSPQGPSSQEPAAAAEPPVSRPGPKPKPKPKPAPKPVPDPAVPPAAKAPAPEATPLALAAYVEAAATTIIAEQSCPGVRLNAGQLTNLRLAARIAPAQEPALEEGLRARATEIRQRLAEDGTEAWCAQALAAFGPGGSAAKGLLAQ